MALLQGPARGSWRGQRLDDGTAIADVLEVADILAGLEIERDQRVGIEVVARAQRSVEIGRRIADHEEDAVGGKIDRGVLPYAAAERPVRVAGLGELVLLGVDAALRVAAGGVLLRPSVMRAAAGYSSRIRQRAPRSSSCPVD